MERSPLPLYEGKHPNSPGSVADLSGLQAECKRDYKVIERGHWFGRTQSRLVRIRPSIKKAIFIPAIELPFQLYAVGGVVSTEK
jgi:hypothetical protein